MDLDPDYYIHRNQTLHRGELPNNSSPVQFQKVQLEMIRRDPKRNSSYHAPRIDTLSGIPTCNSLWWKMKGHRSTITSVLNTNTKGFFTGGWDREIKQWDYEKQLLIRTFSGHSGYVSSLCTNSEETLLFSGSSDGYLRVWDLVSGKCLKEIVAHEGHIQNLEIFQLPISGISGKKYFLLSGSTDRTVKLWDLESLKLAQIIENFGSVRNFVLWKECTLVVCTQEGIDVWNVDSKSSKLMAKFRDNVEYLWICYLAGDTLFSSSFDGVIQAYDMKSLTKKFTLVGHTKVVNNFHNNQRFLFTASQDGTAISWNIETGVPLCVFKGHVASVETIYLYENFLFTGSADFSIRVWNWLNGECVRVWKGHNSFIKFLNVAIPFIISCAQDGTLCVWKPDLFLGDEKVKERRTEMQNEKENDAKVKHVFQTNEKEEKKGKRQSRVALLVEKFDSFSGYPAVRKTESSMTESSIIERCVSHGAIGSQIQIITPPNLSHSVSSPPSPSCSPSTSRSASPFIQNKKTKRKFSVRFFKFKK